MLQALERAKDSLTLQWPDGNWILCYLNQANAATIFGEAAKDSLVHMIQAVSPSDYQLVTQPPQDFDANLLRHKERIEEKLKKYGKNTDIQVGDIKSAELREKVLRKYIWVMAYHNRVCEIYQKQEHKVYTSCNCDTRFLKMTIEVQNNETGV